jgi:hypothetical protein
VKKDKWVVFREEKKLVNLIDKIVEQKGTDRSDFIREAIRNHLSELGFFQVTIKPNHKVQQIDEK